MQESSINDWLNDVEENSTSAYYLSRLLTFVHDLYWYNSSQASRIDILVFIHGSTNENLVLQNIHWILRNIRFRGECEMEIEYWRRWPVGTPDYIKAEVLRAFFLNTEIDFFKFCSQTVQ